MRGNAAPRVFVSRLICRGFTTSYSFRSVPPHTIFIPGRGLENSRNSHTIARKGLSMLRFWPSRCAFNFPVVSEGAWAPPLISIDRDGRWSRWQILFSPCPGVSRLGLYSNYVWRAVFSSGEVGVGSKAPRRAQPARVAFLAAFT